MEAGAKESHQVPPLALNTLPCTSSKPLGLWTPQGPGASLPGSIPTALEQTSLPPLGLHLQFTKVDHDKIFLPGM